MHFDPPKRCRPCRDARNASWSTAVARVTHASTFYLFLEDAEGRVYYASPRAVPVQLAPLEEGALARVWFDPAAPEVDGRRRVTRIRDAADA